MSSLRFTIIPAMLVVAALVCAAPASATDYCVAPNTTCGGTNVGDLQTALDWSGLSDNADRIFLGAGTYTAPMSGFSYDVPTGPVAIIGAGLGYTYLTGPVNGSQGVLKLIGGPGTSVRDLHVVLPTDVASNATGVDTNGVVNHVDVIEDQAQVNARLGIRLQGGELENVFVGLDGNGAASTTAVAFDGNGATVRDSFLSAGTAIITSSSGTIERSELRGRWAGVVAYHGPIGIASSRIILTGSDSTGIFAGAFTANVSINVDGVTLYSKAPLGSNAVGIYANNQSGGTHTASISVDNTLIRNVDSSLRAYSAAVGPGSAKVTAKYSDFDDSGSDIIGPYASLTESDVTNVGNVGFGPDGFEDAPLATSPLIDRGDPNTPQGLDLGRYPLVADGNGDGIARRDIGAVELPGVDVPVAHGDAPTPASDPAPVAPALTPVPPAEPAATDKQAPLVSGFRFKSKRFRYTISERASVVIRITHGRRIVARIARRAAAGANSQRIGKALMPGRYSAVLTATDAAGNHSLPKRVRFRIIGR